MMTTAEILEDLNTFGNITPGDLPAATIALLETVYKAGAAKGYEQGHAKATNDFETEERQKLGL